MPDYTYSNGIAKICRCKQSTISEVLRLSDERMALYHGIKSQKSVESIMRRGIEPLTPEEGYASCWSTGLRLFINSDTVPITNMHTYNTPFFHYAHSDSDVGYSRMQLAITDKHALKASGIKINWLSNAHINIPEVVKPESFTLLILILKHGDLRISNSNLVREHGAKTEKLMIGMLIRHLRDYSIGKTIINESGE